MKRFYLFCLLVLISFPIHAKNKISMVTYFPVPYVAYSQVNTTEQMDIGLTSTCDMKLGCSDESATLNAARVNLKGGKLNLDGGRGIKGNTLVLGNGMSVGQISFQNMRIQTGTMESVNANSMNVNALNLFGKTFPSCKAANGESNGQMQWASLKLKGASANELYLTCGNLETVACAPTHNGQETYTDTCPNGQTGTITYTWDYSACTYKERANCEEAPGINLSIKQQGCPVSWNRYAEEKCQVETPGKYAAGSTIKIKAIPYDPGHYIMDHHKYKFVKWELSSCPGGRIANVNNEETTITLGDSDCELTANYRNLITFQIASSLPLDLRDDYKEAGYYEPGTTITVVATNNKAPWKEFLYWNPGGNCSSGTVKNTYGDRRATITFKEYDPSQINIPNCMVYTEFQ